MVKFMEMSLDRILQIYVIYVLIAALFLFYARKIKTRTKDKEGDNTQAQLLVAFFTLSGGGLVLNMIYAPFDYELVQQIGNFTIFVMTAMGLACLLFFIIYLRFSILEFPKKRMARYLLLVFIISLGVFFIPDAFTLAEGGRPVYSLPMTIYTILLSQVLFFMAIIWLYKFVGTIDDKSVKRRLLLFAFGLLMINVSMLMTFMRNGELVAGTITLILQLVVVPGNIMIYYAVGRDI